MPVLFLKKGRKGVDFERKWDGEDLRVVGRSKTITRIYYMRKKQFSIKERVGDKQDFHVFNYSQDYFKGLMLLILN